MHYTLFIDNCQEKGHTLLFKYKNKVWGDILISYEPFYKTLKAKNMSTYKLINEFGVSRSLLDRLKHNKPISTQTLDDLCNYLDCNVEDIVLHTK